VDWIPGEIWKGRTAFILGGGSSLKDETGLPLVPRETLISTNFGLLLRPDAALELWADDSFMHQALPELRAFQGIRVTREDNATPAREALGDVKFFTQIDGVLSMEPGRLCGKLSGHLAINLALQMGVARIVLLGFDGGEGGNFHDRYTEPVRHDGYVEWNDMMNDLSHAVPKRYPGVEIFNCSAKDSLRCFSYQPLRAFL
jgi:hypothetical protein